MSRVPCPAADCGRTPGRPWCEDAGCPVYQAHADSTPDDGEPGDPWRLRFRVYVEGEQVAEDWAEYASGQEGAALGDLLSRQHVAITQQAGADGKRWLVEIYDPALPEAEAYLRFGTDDGAMTMPVPLQL